jgi:hypothetical protein
LLSVSLDSWVVIDREPSSPLKVPTLLLVETRLSLDAPRELEKPMAGGLNSESFF